MDTSNNSRRRLFQLEPYNRGISDEEILDDMRHVAQSLNQSTLTYAQYDEYGRVRARTAERRFGFWNNALSKAGLQVKYCTNIPIEELFNNLEQVWIKLGRQPRIEEMTKKVSLYHGWTYKKRFGTWRKALQEFVNYVNTDSSDELVLSKSATQTFSRGVRQPNLRLRFLVMRRDNFTCQYCGKSPATHPNIELQVDHIVPWSDGGETKIDNLQTLCAECNVGKSNL
jgi:hypothetical protein